MPLSTVVFTRSYLDDLVYLRTNTCDIGTFCAPNVKPELKFMSFIIKFCTFWLCPVDLGPNWMAEMPSVWFHSCYAGKIFSTFEIFFHLCFNGNWGLQKMPCSLRMEQSTIHSLTPIHLGCRLCSTASSSCSVSTEHERHLKGGQVCKIHIVWYWL